MFRGLRKRKAASGLGTGDALTGIVSALIDSGMDLASSGVKAARVNRLAGYYAKPTPATQVYDIIRRIPLALEEVFSNGKKGWS